VIINCDVRGPAFSGQITLKNFLPGLNVPLKGAQGITSKDRIPLFPFKPFTGTKLCFNTPLRFVFGCHFDNTISREIRCNSVINQGN
jgi:hypothetical protein